MSGNQARLRVLMVVGDYPTESRPILTFVASQVDSLRALGVHCEVWNLSELGRGRGKYLRGLTRIRSQVRADVDLVHAHFGYCGWIARWQTRRPVVVSFLGVDLLGSRDARGRLSGFGRAVVGVNRRLARSVDAVIVKSQEMARVLAPARTHVIANGVDLEMFRPHDRRAVRATLGWAPEGHYVLFSNCPHRAIKNFPLARAAVDAAERRLGHAINLVPLCEVPFRSVAKYMSAADALIMTSHSEGSPNVVKEALACNLPVISVPVGDVADLLAGLEGCTVSPRDPEALARAIADRVTAAAAIDGRSALLARGLDLQSVARRVLAIYTEVLARRANPSPGRSTAVSLPS